MSFFIVYFFIAMLVERKTDNRRRKTALNSIFDGYLRGILSGGFSKDGGKRTTGRNLAYQMR